MNDCRCSWMMILLSGSKTSQCHKSFEKANRNAHLRPLIRETKTKRKTISGSFKASGKWTKKWWTFVSTLQWPASFYYTIFELKGKNMLQEESQVNVVMHKVGGQLAIFIPFPCLIHDAPSHFHPELHHNYPNKRCFSVQELTWFWAWRQDPVPKYVAKWKGALRMFRLKLFLPSCHSPPPISLMPLCLCLSLTAAGEVSDPL